MGMEFAPCRRLGVLKSGVSSKFFKKSVNPCHTTSSKPLSIGSYHSFRCDLASSRTPFSDLNRAKASCQRMKWRQHEHTWTSSTWIWSVLSIGLSSLHHATKIYGVHGGNLHTFLTRHWFNWLFCLPPPSSGTTNRKLLEIN